jgi:hypothetical protein
VFNIDSFDEVEGVLGESYGLPFAGQDVPAVLHYPDLDEKVDRRFDVLFSRKRRK